MIQSMTGYGKAVCSLEGGELTVEIRSLNGKSLDLNIRSQLLPKDRELEVRSRIAAALVRGTVDVYLTWTPSSSSASLSIDGDKLRQYYLSLSALANELGAGQEALFSSILSFPDVLKTHKADIISEQDWPAVSGALDACLDRVVEYRSKEGAALYKDVTSRVRNILAIYDEVELLEPERVEAVRGRILSAAEDLSLKLDRERFEQEMIFYLEKYDINEEKVRLRQHCRYFLETIDAEPYPGKKLGFIIQEMGREINTTGSKASHAGIQKCVVRMKDELEKIREQSMNIL